ncbi:WD domain, G-beta repeat protein [Teladorsagia circumcincta]|uniref:WD domain, G-beta repeat protein n=1 Tax=Teladorsagia circumcincta TaxID=45464 RepID=A0A2G9V2Y9_TELCI|nr:WD domain, G-beta repeat protein [Teladorsagia circumcincta]
MDRWEKDGITGVIDHVANITEDSKLWPISRLERPTLYFPIRRTGGMCVKDERTGKEVFKKMGKNNWLRCVAVHDEGRRLALCQNNNYIRVYNIGPNQKTPLTLKHPLQNNVACMAWEPFDQRVLAVAANNKILIWRLSVKATNIKPSVRCAQVIELPAVPVSQIVWDRTTTNVLLAVSPNSSKIMIVDISTGEVDCFGAWTGGNITRIVPTNDGRRLAVLYTGNIIRVYDRSTWREERWSGLAGRAVSAVWSPSGDSLVFSSEDSYQIYAISFVAKNEMNEDGITEA